MENLLHGFRDVDTAEYLAKEERRASARRRKNAIKASSRCHLALMAYIIISSTVIGAVQYAIMFLFDFDKAAELLTSPYILLPLQVLGMYIVAFPLFALMTSGIPSRKYKDGSKMTLGEFVVIFMISQAIMVAGNLISGYLTELIEGTTNTPIDDFTSQLIMASPTWLIVLVVVILGPIVEELIFRKIFIDKLSIYGDRLAIVISSISFGLIHGNLYQLFYATAVGLLLGYVYTKTRKIKYSCLLHILINFMGSVPSKLLMPGVLRLDELSQMYPDGDIPVTEVYEMMSFILGVISYTFVQYGLAIAGFVLFIVLTVKRAYKVPNTCDYRLPAKAIPRVAFFNLGIIIFFLWSALEILLTIFPDAPIMLVNAINAAMQSAS